MIKYQYTENSLLQSVKENYSYSSNFGLPFIEAYLKNREHALMSTTRMLPLNTKEEMHNYLLIEVLNKRCNLTFIEGLFIEKCGQCGVSIYNDWIFQLIRSFEVSKRLFLNYNEDFRRITNEEASINDYSLFSVMLVSQYEENTSLIVLNTLLKVNDIIISVMKCAGELNELNYYSILKEIEFVKILLSDFRLECNK